MMALGLSSNKGHRLSPAIVHSKYQIWTNYEGLGMFAHVLEMSISQQEMGTGYSTNCY